MISKPIPYGRQHITDEDIRAVIDTLKSDYLTQGPKIREFETKFAEYVGAQYDLCCQCQLHPLLWRRGGIL